MDGEAGWWTTSGNIGLPPLARAMGVGRQQHHSDMLSAQFLVNCLEEDHVSHGITIQESRPRFMKEIFYSRHHSTVLLRLGSNRMGILQNLHTHAVDSAIQLQGNNRVLRKHPPPISGEEQRLNRRQRCTLSQLRPGHCHILQDYKHRGGSTTCRRESLERCVCLPPE